MFPPKKASSMNSQERGMCVQPDTGLVLTTDPKPRLRWTSELHERFVDAVTQLGGPDKATPKTIMRVMGVNGLTLYHLKSHLQKFRLGKQPHKDFNDHNSIKNASALELQRNSASSSAMIGRNMNEMQMEVQRRLHEQLEVQKHLQLRIEAQGKYMQSILEKAYQTLAGENMKNNNINGAHHLQANMMPPQDFTSIPLNPNFSSSFQDQLNIYGGDQLDHHHLHPHQFMPNSSNNTDQNLCVLGMNNNNNNNKNKRPLIWNNEDHHHHLGGIASSSCLDTDPFKDVVSFDRITSSSENNINIDHISDIYDTKPLLHQVDEDTLEDTITDHKKLERPSPKRAHHSLHQADQRMSPMISTGTPF